MLSFQKVIKNVATGENNRGQGVERKLGGGGPPGGGEGQDRR